MIKSICEKIMIFVNRNINMEILILKINRKKIVFKWLMVFVMVRLVLFLFLIFFVIIFFLFLLLLEFGLVESRFFIWLILIFLMFELLYWSSSYGCWICMENRLFLIKFMLFLFWLLEWGMIIFVLSDKLVLLMFDEKLLIFLM